MRCYWNDTIYLILLWSLNMILIACIIVSIVYLRNGCEEIECNVGVSRRGCSIHVASATKSDFCPFNACSEYINSTFTCYQYSTECPKLIFEECTDLIALVMLVLSCVSEVFALVWAMGWSWVTSYTF